MACVLGLSAGMYGVLLRECARARVVCVLLSIMQSLHCLNCLMGTCIRLGDATTGLLKLCEAGMAGWDWARGRSRSKTGSGPDAAFVLYGGRGPTGRARVLWICGTVRGKLATRAPHQRAEAVCC